MNTFSHLTQEVANNALLNVSSQVINYIEGFHLSATNEDLTTLLSNHAKRSYDVIEKVFNSYNLSQKFDIRSFYRLLWFNYKEISRISEEVEYKIKSLYLKFRLRNHTHNPERLDNLYEELFNIINVDDKDKPRFKASMSTIMTQCIRDILEVNSDKTRFALVLYGLQGCGKSTFNQTLCRVLIGKDVHVQKNSLYTGFDNEAILNPVFRVEDLNYEFRKVIDVMKTYITNTGQTTINIKYKPMKTVNVRTTPLMDTNNDFINIIKTDGEQRRFCIFELQPSIRIEKFEEKLEDVLERLYNCHTTDYYYDLYELQEANLELTDTSSEIIDYMRHYLARVISNDADFTIRELKKIIKNGMEERDSEDTFLPDNLLMKIIKIYFHSEWNSYRKTNVYNLKKKSIYTGNTGNTGSFENPLIKRFEQKSFSKNPVNPVTPVKMIPYLYNIKNYKLLTFDQYLLYFRDEYIDNVIIKNNRVQFYGDTTQIDSREALDVSTFQIVETPLLYTSKEKINPYNTNFPVIIPIKTLKNFKDAVKYDNIGSNFEGNVAKNENFISTNMLMIDIDSHHGEDISNVENIDKLGFEYYQVKSKSGHGYHYYFPLSHTITDVEQFKTVMDKLMTNLQDVGINVDVVCKNPSRKFYATGNYDSSTYHKGKRFDVIQALSRDYRLLDNSQHYEKSVNNSLTDNYMAGNINSGQVVKDLPHIMNYLITLRKNNKKFYSEKYGKYFTIEEVINDVKDSVKYDNTHVQYIDWFLNKEAM